MSSADHIKRGLDRAHARVHGPRLRSAGSDTRKVHLPRYDPLLQAIAEPDCARRRGTFRLINSAVEVDCADCSGTLFSAQTTLKASAAPDTRATVVRRLRSVAGKLQEDATWMAALALHNPGGEMDAVTAMLHHELMELIDLLRERAKAVLPVWGGGSEEPEGIARVVDVNGRTCHRTTTAAGEQPDVLLWCIENYNGGADVHVPWSGLDFPVMARH